jgi:phytol kinase
MMTEGSDERKENEIIKTPEDPDPVKTNVTDVQHTDVKDQSIGSNFSAFLKKNLQNNYFALVFGFVVGFPIIVLLYFIGGSDIFTSEGGTINRTDVAIFLPLNIVFIVGMNYFAGWLKREKGWKTNYTRKITHISNFTFLMILTYFGGYTASFIFALLMIGYGTIIIMIGNGNIFYEAVAREQDDPYRAFYLIIPSVATMLAVLLNRTFFGDYANLGYLVAGWGDAAGEPIGVRFGKHRYKVPTLTGIPCTRSIEGSAAVFLVGSFAAIFSLITLLDVSPLLAIGAGLAAGFGATLVEAISFHGVDNFTIQVAAVAMAYVIIEVLV